MTVVERPAAWCVALAAAAAPWALGAVETSWASLLAAACLVPFAASAAAQACVRRDRRDAVLPVPGLLVICVPLVAFLGLVPLPGVVRSILAPGATALLAAAESGADSGWRPLSLAPHATTAAVAAALAWCAAFVLVTREAARPGGRTAVVTPLVISGVGLAVLGIVQDRTQAGNLYPRIYWKIELYEAGTPFGPYVNRNHFAGAMVVLAGIAAGEALALFSGFAASRRRAASPAAVSVAGNSILPPVRAPKAWLVGAAAHSAAAITMLAALGATTSRGGALAAASAAVFLVGCAPAGRRIRAVAGIAAIVGLIAAVLAWTGVLDSFLARMSGLYGRWRNRFAVQRDALAAFTSSPILGTGAGTFEDVYPAFQRVADERSFQNAHSDWAQLLMETGVAGAALAVACVRAAWRRVRSVVAAGPGPARWRAAGPAAGVVGVVVHGFFEVNLHIPANALLTACALSLACSATPDPAPEGPERPS